MKVIRHVSQLDQLLDKSLAWRKKELTGLKFVVDTAGASENLVLCRAGVTLLYAHWEGFVKETATGYLRLVAGQKLPLAKLTSNFVAMGLMSQIKVAGASNQVTMHSALVEKIAEGLSQVAFTQWKGLVRTKANLKSVIFREILSTLDLAPELYAASSSIAIDRLVEWRNAVAHGQYLSIATADYDALYADILGVIQIFRDQVGDAATGKRYLRAAT